MPCKRILFIHNVPILQQLAVVILAIVIILTTTITAIFWTYHNAIIFPLQDDIKAQRDKLLREREALQKQMDLFEQVKAQTAREQLQQQQQHQQQDSYPTTMGALPLRSDSPSSSTSSQRSGSSRTPDSPSVRPVPPSSVPQTLWDNVAHKRSSSEDLQRPNQGEGYEPMKQEYSNSLKEPLNSNRDSREPHREMRRDSRSRSDSRPRLHVSPQSGSGNTGSVSSSTGSSGHRDSMSSSSGKPPRDVSLPIHLVSATNEQKVGQVTQQLPLKLLALGSSSKSTSSLQSSTSSGSKFSYKLTSDSPPSASSTSVSPTSGQVAVSATGAGGAMSPTSSSHQQQHHPHHHHHHHSAPPHGHQHKQPQKQHNQQLLQQTPVTYSTTGANMVPIPPTKHVTMPPNMSIVNPGGTVIHPTSSATSGRVGGRQQSGAGHVTHSILPMKLASGKGRQKSTSPSPTGSQPTTRSMSLTSPSTHHPGGAGAAAGAAQSSADTPKSSKHSQRSSHKEHIIYF